jgi:hypothetical protein
MDCLSEQTRNEMDAARLNDYDQGRAYVIKAGLTGTIFRG